MMPQITLSDSLFNRLKALAEPFVDTPESVLTRCIDFYASNHKPGANPSGGNIIDAGVLIFPPDGAPDLTFSRPVAIKINGANFDKKDLWWNNLMTEVIKVAAKKCSSVNELKSLILVNYMQGKGDLKKGFRYLPEANISIQGQDANAAWRATLHVVRAVKIPLDVTFIWENKDKAAHPGKTGKMFYAAM